MNSLKSSTPRALRSGSTIFRSGIPSIYTRTITRTTRNGSLVNPTSQSQRPHQFIPQDSLSRTTIKTPHTQPITANPFNTLLAAITASLISTPTAHLPTLTNLLRSYTSNPTHWSPYAHANADKQYTRNLVTGVPGIFNLLLLVWTPGKMSPVHDHAGAHCLMKVLKGDLVERRFETPDVTRRGKAQLKETSRREFGEGKVAYMSDELGLHEISNPSPMEYAVSLHLYTPPNAAVRGCDVYDLENGDAKHVMQCGYDSVNGVPINHVSQ